MNEKIIKIDLDDLKNVTGGRENFKRNPWAKRFKVGKKRKKDDDKQDLND